ncbi:MAG: peptide chain release factor 2 [bacterium]|nr:peptide chain release factor 2 [bacterium]
MKPIIEKLTNLLEEVNLAIDQIKLADDKKKLTDLENQIANPKLWDDRENAEKLTIQASETGKYIESWESLKSDISSLLDIAQISDEKNTTEFEAQYQDLKSRAEKTLIDLKLSGENDDKTAILQISAGVGGVDAMDWAEMLMNMYIKYANKSGLKAELVGVSYGEEAGIKSATLEITGKFAYGKLKGEKGVHRLVRQSPYNAKNLRQTSFALVDVIPEISQEKLEINSDDLKIDTFRASGHGGQSVNTTDSAVRVTHLPTSITISIQNERSQLKNKQKALSILSSKLTQLAREQKLASIAEIRGKLTSANWGDQIRSYVLHPYTLVKDHRTGQQTSAADKVLAGDIEPFIEAYLNKLVSRG